jgi:hypothetical protein
MRLEVGRYPVLKLSKGFHLHQGPLTYRQKEQIIEQFMAPYLVVALESKRGEHWQVAPAMHPDSLIHDGQHVSFRVQPAEWRGEGGGPVFYFSLEALGERGQTLKLSADPARCNALAAKLKDFILRPVPEELRGLMLIQFDFQGGTVSGRMAAQR